MAGLVDAQERAVLDHFTGKTTWTLGATKYIALFTVAPNEAGTGFTEVTTSGSAYARISTVAADWAAATGTAPASATTSAVKTFATATASWGTVVAFGICTAGTAGTSDILAWGLITPNKTIDSGDTASFAAGALTLKCGDPGDTY